MENNNTNFIDFLKTPVEGVKPFSLLTAAIIALILGLVDTVGCVVLIISAYIFVKMGHKGMGALLALVNILIPDALPLFDEIGGIVVVVLPLYKQWQEKNNIITAVTEAIESKEQYEEMKTEGSVNDSADLTTDEYSEELL